MALKRRSRTAVVENRGAEFAEKVFYETRPYLFLGFGLAALYKGGSNLMNGSGVLLILTAGFIVLSRLRNRGFFKN